MMLALFAGVVAGIVVEEPSGAPVRKAEVQLISGQQGRSALTDAEGRFRLEGVPPGRYTVRVNKAGYQFLETGRNSSRTTLEVIQGGNETGLRYALRPLGLIAGRVVDADGDPVAGARLVLLRQAKRFGKALWLPGQNSATSDDRGEFRLFGVPPGRYVLGCAPVDVRTRLVIQGGRMGAAPVFYPDAPEPEMAQVLDVKAGARFEGLTVQTRVVPQFLVRGKVTGLAGEQGMGVHVTVEQGSWAQYLGSSRGGAVMREGGEFLAGPLPPGVYTLFAQQMRMNPQADGTQRPPEQLAGAVQVIVADRDIEGVTIQLGAGIIVEGQVTLEGEKETAIKGLFIMAQSSGESGYAQGGETKADGSFQFHVGRPGKYFFRPPPEYGGRYLASIRIGGEEVLGREVDLTYGSPGSLRVVYKKDSGWVEGAVQSREGAPVGAEGLAVLWPVDERFRLFAYRFTAPVSGGGSFAFKNVPPGDYLVFALPRAALGFLHDGADADKEILDQAAPVKVVAGSGSTVEIPWVQWPDESR